LVDRALRRGDRPEGAASAHADRCPRCSARIAAFAKIDETAPALRKRWDSPELLGRILAAVEAGGLPAAAPAPASAPRRLPPWVPAVYAAALVLLSTLGLWVFRDAPNRNPFSGSASESPFLGDEAMREVERKEADYVAAIDRLSRIAAASTAPAPSALAANYRERLLVIDSAIAECRAQIDQNRYNAHLRRQLLAMYDEKKRTLEDLLKEVKS
ncbi:MAG TPA: hypothetical protein VG777_00365, partial [Thermoanaerobaculia bacterium]|nr:hypothetical protein [Thermoanaerobaculia bacterium]